MRPKTYRLYDALQRRESQLEEIIDSVTELDRFYLVYVTELNEVKKALTQIDITTEI